VTLPTRPSSSRSGSTCRGQIFRGSTLRIGDREQASHAGVAVRADALVTLVNGGDESELLLLQGRPIGERVARHGPFVVNTPHEIRQAFDDCQRTGFGGWPWPSDGPVHARE
jgi:redox-sensitive bicupin YhaK (pirin superfamily)